MNIAVLSAVLNIFFKILAINAQKVETLIFPVSEAEKFDSLILFVDFSAIGVAYGPVLRIYKQ